MNEYVVPSMLTWLGAIISLGAGGVMLHKSGAFSSLLPMSQGIGRGAKWVGDKAAKVGVASSLVGVVGLAAYCVVEWCAMFGWCPIGYEPMLEWPYPPVLLVTSLMYLMSFVHRHEWEVERDEELTSQDKNIGRMYLDKCSCGQRRTRKWTA